MLIKRLMAAFAAFAMISPAFSVYAEDDGLAMQIYVSQNGSDSGDGSINSPFATIDAAKNYLRTQKNNLKKGRIEVIIDEGVYLLENSVAFSQEDSGSADNPICYKGADGKEVKITNSEKIDQNKFMPVSDQQTLERIPEDARDFVFEIDLKSLGITEYGQAERKEYGKGVTKYFELYFNGTPLSLSRYPNDKYMLTGQVVEKGGSGVTFKFEGDRYKNWAQADQAIVYGFWSNGYGDDAMVVSQIDQATGEISTETKPYFGIKSDRRYYIYNLLEEIDEPGEYFLDRNTGKLYLYPPEDIYSADIEMCTNNKPFVTINNAQYISFENILFEGSCGNAFQIESSKFIDINFCRIMNIAGTAVTIAGGSDCTVYGCELYNLGGAGIVSYSGNRNTLTPGNITVKNNHIHKFAQYSKTYTPAVNLLFVGNTVTNNVIHDCPHTAILTGGNNNVIMYNEIYDVCQETDDCGAIYGGRDWTTYGNVISNNYIHDVRGPGSQSIGIYCDDMMSGMTMENNVIDSVTQAFGIGGGHNNKINNNLIMNKTKYSTAAMYYDDRGLQAWFGGQYEANPSEHQLTKNLQAVPYKSDVWVEAYPDLAPSVENDPLMPKGGIVTNNLVSSHKQFDIADTVIENGTVENNYSTENTITINRDERGKYSFDDPYGVFGELDGFKVPDIENVGLLDDWRFDYPEKFVYEEKKVEYVKMEAPEVDVTPLLNNPEGWDNSVSKVTKNGDVLEITPGTTGYLNEQHENAKMKFKFAMDEKTSWAGFMLHSSLTNKVPWEAGKCYFIVVKKDALELQRWYSGSQLMIRTYENVTYPGDNEYANVEFEIANLEDNMGTSVIFRYNGLEVFNYTDTEEQAVISPGYFAVYSSGEEGSSVKLGAYDSNLQREVAVNPYGQGGETSDKKELRIRADGKFMSFNTQPVIINNRVYVPCEEFFKQRGAKTFVNVLSDTVIAAWGDNKFAAKSGMRDVAFGGKVINMENEVRKEDGIIMIPVAEIAQILGYNVSWDETTYMVTLKSEE